MPHTDTPKVSHSSTDLTNIMLPVTVFTKDGGFVARVGNTEGHGRTVTQAKADLRKAIQLRLQA